MLAVSPLAYLLGLIPGLLVVVGNLRGGAWTLGATIFLVGLCIADWFAKDNREPLPHSSDLTPDLILILHVVINSLAIASLVYGVSSGLLPRWRVGDATLSTGLNSGISGIVVAHELIHRRGRVWRLAGLWNLLLVNYSHFYIEHIKGHHRHVGSPRDASTARPRESIYHYLLRSLPQQFVLSVQIESERMKKADRFRFGLGNFVILSLVIQVAIAATIGLVLGPRTLSAYLWQGLIAVVLLQMVNYLQHSGLERTEGARVVPAHSWQSDRISSRFLLLELSRHADHHCHASRPYHELTSHEDSPNLPFGLLGTIPVLLIPPLWFALARRAVESTPAGPIEKTAKPHTRQTGKPHVKGRAKNMPTR